MEAIGLVKTGNEFDWPKNDPERVTLSEPFKMRYQVGGLTEIRSTAGGAKDQDASVPWQSFRIVMFEKGSCHFQVLPLFSG